MERLTNREFDRAWCNVECGETGVFDCEECPQFQKIRDKLEKYEGLEEQGLLIKLPCKIGDDVYIIPSKVNFDLNVITRHKENNKVYHQKIANIVFKKDGWYMTADKDAEFGTGRIFLDIFYKKTWFLTKAEAEEALKKMEER